MFCTYVKVNVVTLQAVVPVSQECKEMIKMTEKQGYVKALVNIGGGRQKLMPEVRNNYRCIVDSFEKAAEIWDRIKHLIPEKWRGRKALGLNERLRFLRYDPGQEFKPHFDGSYVRDNGEASYLTIQLYLNEGFTGGATTFLENFEFGRNDVDCVPKIGRVLVFQHDILHSGSKLMKGRKYCLRTDVMFSRD
ncbi:uncharacterized protein LOC114517123 isoform X2 [Dendronephthya gigantea]|uniref:uncharacterized protein LOC114517123 isoform X2 n=1 Tax=Dendronephthya gigantea TaxID=151771 RepID=UPI001068F272|nr:uncharacterized protein LOC114517123 isoform X2 [Dendronephthya gigantea]